MTKRSASFTPTRLILFFIAALLLPAPQVIGQTTKYPGIPAIEPRDSHPPSTVAAFKKATLSAVAWNQWKEHLDATESALMNAMRTRSLTQEQQLYERFLKSGLGRLMLVQSAFIRLLTPESLASLCEDSYKRP